MQCFMNKASRPKSAEIIQDVLGHTLNYPCIYYMVEFFLSICASIKQNSISGRILWFSETNCRCFGLKSKSKTGKNKRWFKIKKKNIYVLS